MKKIHYLLLGLITICLSSCFASVLGSAIKLGFRMGVYSILFLFGILCWVIYKRSRRR